MMEMIYIIVAERDDRILVTIRAESQHNLTGKYPTCLLTQINWELRAIQFQPQQ